MDTGSDADDEIRSKRQKTSESEQKSDNNTMTSSVASVVASAASTASSAAALAPWETVKRNRYKQCSILQFCLSKSHTTIPGVCVFGGPATGKTTAVLSLMKHHQLIYGYVDCRICVNESDVFTALLCQLSEADKLAGGKGIQGYSSYHATVQTVAESATDVHVCRQIDVFCDKLKTAEAIKNNTIYLVLDHAALLLEFSKTAIAALLRVGQFIGRNVCVVFIVTGHWNLFTHINEVTGGIPLLPSHFELYDSKALISILELLEGGNNRDIREVSSLHFFKSFITYIVNTCQEVTRDLLELRHIAKILMPAFRTFCEQNTDVLTYNPYSVTSASSSSSSSSSSPSSSSPPPPRYELMLINALKPLVIVALTQIYQHELNPMDHGATVSRAQTRNRALDVNAVLSSVRAASFSSPLSPSPSTPSSSSRSNGFGLADDGFGSELGRNLSLTSKYLLLAAFLASYNPSDKDKEIFDSRRGKKRRRGNGGRAKPKEDGSAHFQQIVLGPKWFNYDRLFAIMQAISMDSGASQEFDNLSRRTEQLVATNLLSKQASKNALLGEAKLRCNVNYTQIVEVATSIRFALGQWLYNP